MSHTDKDRPYWVKSNDPFMPRHEYHNHSSFGRSFTRTRHARDAAGNYLYTHHVDHMPVLKENMGWYLEFHGNNWPYQIRHPRDYARFYTHEYRDRWEPVWEKYTVTYPDHCTIDEPRPAGDRLRRNPCTYYIDDWYISAWGTGPSKYDRQDFNGSQRRHKRDSLRNYVKEVNAADSWEDLDDSVLAPDRHRHTIIWW